MKKAIVLILLVTGITAAGIVGTLAYVGKISLPFLQRAVPHLASRPLAAGEVRVPWTYKRIPANTAVTRDDLIDPETRAVATTVVRLEKFKVKPFTDASQIIGRVLNHDKNPGYVFTEGDFYPPGTRPGEAAAIPPGKRAVTLPVAKISGVRSLHTGDHVDLVSAQSFDPTKAGATIGLPGLVGRTAGPLPMGATPQHNPPVKQATFAVLVQNGVVVAPLTTRQIPYEAAGGMTTGPQMKTKPVEEIEIAVAPDEVPGLMEALAVDANVSCFVHSGQPAISADRPIPSTDPKAARGGPDVRIVERIVNGKHESQVVPTAAMISSSPAAPATDDATTTTFSSLPPSRTPRWDGRESPGPTSAPASVGDSSTGDNP